MEPRPITLILDTGPLSHLAQTDNIHVVENLVELGLSPRFPREVKLELEADRIANDAALTSSAIKQLKLDGAAEKQSRKLRDRHLRNSSSLTDFARPKHLEGGKNAGEAACIAYAELSVEQGQPCVYIDDWDGRTLARRRGLVCLSTLDLLACLVRLGHLGRSESEKIVDDLKQGSSGRQGYRLPVDSGTEFTELYQLVDQLPAPQGNEECDGCLRANQLEPSAPANVTHSLCHLVSGWNPPCFERISA